MHFTRTALGSILTLFALSTAFLGATATDADQNGNISVNGLTRTYVYYVPTSLRPHAALVLSFHGHGGDGAGQSKLTQLDELAEARGFIAVYPDGVNRGWNDGRPENAGVDDVAFVKALISDFSQRYSVDPKRIYATGFSNGAMFSQHLGCVLSSQIAAIAPVSGSMPETDAPGCKPRRPLSVLEIGGTADPVVPFTGGDIKMAFGSRGTVLSAEQTISFWKLNAHCDQSPDIVKLPPTAPDDGTSVVHSTYTGCASGTGVEFYTVVGGGHAWPGGPQYLPKWAVGKASTQLDASRVIVDFFYAHPAAN